MNTFRHEPWRLRGDLRIIARGRRGRREHWIANAINGRVARVDEADYHRLTNTDQTEREHHAEIAALVGASAAAGFLHGTNPPETPRRGWWTNPLYIRLPGLAGDRIARIAADLTPWLFSRSAVMLWGFAILITAAAMLNHQRMLWSSLQGLASFQSRHWVLALLTLGLTKVLHELAHAAVCQRMGARCREMGVLLLCGTPCLYCDVSDSWRVGSRRRRIAVMLAGIYVEWILAACAAWVWMMTESPQHRMIAFHIMAVCGVSTMIININPLMRYDGYFVLSDLLNLTNLRQRATEAWQSTVIAPIAGPGYAASRVRRPRVARLGLSLYFLASLIYRIAVTTALCGWLYLVAAQAGLAPIGRMLLIIIVAIMVAGVARGWVNVVRGGGAWRAVSSVRRWLVGGALAAAVIAALSIPVERRISVGGVVDLENTSTIYVPTTATVAEVFVGYGETIGDGDRLATLASPELERDHQRNLVQFRQAEMRYRDLIERSLRRPQVHEEIDAYRGALAAAEAQLSITTRMLDQLTLRSPCDGTVMRASMSKEPAPAGQSPRLVTMDDRRGSTLDEGSVWCRIGQRQTKRVVLEIDATERRFIAVGDRVRVSIDQQGGTVTECPVIGISEVQHDQRLGQATPSPERFMIACRLPEDVAEEILVGASAVGVVRGTPVRLWDLIVQQATGRHW